MNAAPTPETPRRPGLVPALACFALVAAAALAVHPFAYADDPLKWAALAIVAALALLARPLRLALDRPLGGPAKALGAALLVACVSGFLGDGALALRAAGATQLALFVFVVVAAREAGWAYGPRLLRACTGLGVAMAAMACAQAYGLDPLYGAQSVGAAVATLGNQSAFAAWLAPLVVLGFAGAIARPRPASLAGLVVLVLALVLAGRRGGWLAAAGGIAVVSFLHARSLGARGLRTPLVALGAAVLVGAIGAPGGAEAGADDVLGLERRSNQIRAAALSSSLELVSEAPLLGHGPGSFPVEFPRVRDPEEAQIPTRGGALSVVDQPHCEPVRLAVEGGLLLAVAMVLFALGVLRHLLNTEQVSRDDAGPDRHALLGAWCAALLASLTWSTLHDAATAALLGVLAGAALASRIEVETRGPRIWGIRASALALAAAFVVFAVPAGWAEWRTASLCGGLELVDGVPQLRDEAQREDFLEDVEAAADVAPDDPTRQVLAGAFLLQSSPKGHPASPDRLDRAAVHLRRALSVHPHHTGALRLLARVEVRRQSPDAALAALRPLARLEPWRGTADARLQELLLGQGQIVLALVLRYRTGGDGALAEILPRVETLRAEDPEQAARVLDQLLAEGAQAPEVHRLFSRVLQQLKYETGARAEGAAYARAVRDAGTLTDAALQQEAGQEAREGSILLALGIHQALVEAAPADPQRHTDYAQALQNAGLLDEEQRERRLSQLGWAVVNVVQHQDWANAAKNLGFAERYGEGGGLEESLLRARVELGEGRRDEARARLEALPAGGGPEVLPWVIPALDGLFRDRGCATQLRRLEVPRE